MDIVCLTMDEPDSSCLTCTDGATHFTDDSFISINSSNCLDNKKSQNAVKLSRQSSVQRLFEDLESISDCSYGQGITEDLLDVVEHGRNSLTVDHFPSFLNCSSPSSSSGCESDFTSSSYSDEQFPYSDDVGFLSLSEEPFTNLFPALFWKLAEQLDLKLYLPYAGTILNHWWFDLRLN